MTKFEFLNDLKAALADNVSQEVMNENMRYYDDYIFNEVKKGKTEAEVLDSLGDPRLIARTIIDTSGSNLSRSTYADESWEEEGTSSKDKGDGASSSGRKKPFMKPETGRKIRFYVTVALILILVVLLIVFMVTAVGALLYIFWPVLAVLVIIHLITRNNRYR